MREQKCSEYCNKETQRWTAEMDCEEDPSQCQGRNGQEEHDVHSRYDWRLPQAGFRLCWQSWLLSPVKLRNIFLCKYFVARCRDPHDPVGTQCGWAGRVLVLLSLRCSRAVNHTMRRRATHVRDRPSNVLFGVLSLECGIELIMCMLLQIHRHGWHDACHPWGAQLLSSGPREARPRVQQIRS